MAEVIKIGVTERGDPAWDKSWVQKLQRTNIVITKNVRRVTDELLENQDRCILHATITGLGGTVLEPNVPVPNDSIDAVVELSYPKVSLRARSFCAWTRSSRKENGLKWLSASSLPAVRLQGSAFPVCDTASSTCTRTSKNG